MQQTELVQTVETAYGDSAVLSYAPLEPAAIEASCRSTKDGAVVSFVRLRFVKVAGQDIPADTNPGQVGYTRDEFQGPSQYHPSPRVLGVGHRLTRPVSPCTQDVL